jgi:AcrR family transcriptional regulator
MARIRNFDRTRVRLVEAAGRLFGSQGYDATSVERIVQQAGVSKGAFYHHFSSKEDVLNAVCEAMVAESMRSIQSADSEPSGGAMARLNRFIGAARSWSVAHFGLLKEVVAVLYRDENATMRRKIEALTAAASVPLLADIVRQGVEEDVFDCPDPEETSRLILHVSSAVREAQVRTMLESPTLSAALPVLQRRWDVLVEMLERMLGARRGSLARVSTADIARMIEAERAAAAGSAKKAGAS